MTISDQDFEIFAMDTYNRGYGKALIHGKKQIDSAEKLLVSPMGNTRQ